MTIEDTIRQVVREEVRAAVREEVRAALAEVKPTGPTTTATLLTIEQVAERAGGVKPTTVRAWIHSGRLVAQRAGHRYVVSLGALESFLIGCAAQKHATIDPDAHLSKLMGRIAGSRTKR